MNNVQDEKKSCVKQNTTMDSLLNQLDEQVSRYYNTVNDIRSTRLNIQGESPSTQSESDLKPGNPFNPGVFYRFHELLERLQSLNNDAALEAKILSGHF